MLTGALLAFVFQTSQAQQIYIDPNYSAPLIRPGYHLIFQDEFNGAGLNLDKWDRSTAKPVDVFPCYDHLYDHMLSQVTVLDGKMVLKTEEANVLNSNCVPYDFGCENGKRGIGGEVKTFQDRDYSQINPDFPNGYFKNYQFPVGSYIEIKAKTTDAECNAGSSFWLWGGDQEIDIFETNGDSDDFTSGYWSG